MISPARDHSGKAESNKHDFRRLHLDLAGGKTFQRVQADLRRLAKRLKLVCSDQTHASTQMAMPHNASPPPAAAVFGASLNIIW